MLQQRKGTQCSPVPCPEGYSGPGRTASARTDLVVPTAKHSESARIRLFTRTLYFPGQYLPKPPALSGCSETFPNAGAGQTQADEARMFCYSGPTEENGFFLSLDDSLKNLALTCSIPLS
ncbi:unnamed protein product [Arctogadus glacialis]